MIETYNPDSTQTLNLTDKAVKHFKAYLTKKQGNALRLSLKKNGCSGLSYVNEVVNEQPDNHTKMDFDGLTVYVDNKAKEYIEGTTIDLIQKDLGLDQLAYYNPKETARCGCGESFSVKDDFE